MNEDEIFALYQALSYGARDFGRDEERLTALAPEARARQLDPATQQNWAAALRNCLHAIAETPTLLVRALSMWLTVDADVPLAAALLAHANREAMTLDHPTELPLDAVSIDQAILVAYRLCSRHTSPQLSLGWLLSMARTHPNDGSVQRAVEKLLKHLADEFPRTTLQLLESDACVFRNLPAVQATTTVLVEQAAASRARPRLREFAMTASMRLQHASLKRDEQRDIERGTRQRSVMMQMVRSQRVKYASRVSIQVADHDAVREVPMAMTEMRHTLELPLSESTDPLIGFWVRKKLGRGPDR
ncbi:hypothetical protein [Tahibacter aquaticus]|nr:hypothetical protein [Tahibacter aquaticus]